MSNSSDIFCGETRKAKNTKGGSEGVQTTWKLRRIFSSGGGHLILFKGLLLQGSPYCIRFHYSSSFEFLQLFNWKISSHKVNNIRCPLYFVIVECLWIQFGRALNKIMLWVELVLYPGDNGWIGGNIIYKHAFPVAGSCPGSRWGAVVLTLPVCVALLIDCFVVVVVVVGEWIDWRWWAHTAHCTA